MKAIGIMTVIAIRSVVKEREPSERTTVVKKDHGDGTRSKTVIHDSD